LTFPPFPRFSTDTDNEKLFSLHFFLATNQPDKVKGAGVLPGENERVKVYEPGIIILVIVILPRSSQVICLCFGQPPGKHRPQRKTQFAGLINARTVRTTKQN